MENPHRKKVDKSAAKRPGIYIVIALLMVLAFMTSMADLMQVMTKSKIQAEGWWNTDQAEANAEYGLSLGILSQTKPDTYQKILKRRQTEGAILEKDPVTDTVRKITFDPKGDFAGNTVEWKVVDAIGGKGQGCKDAKSPDQGVQTQEECKNNLLFVYPFPGSGTVGGGECDATKVSTVKDERWYEDMYFYMFGKEYSGQNILTAMKDPPQSIEGENLTALKNATENLMALDHPCMWNTLKTGVSAEIPFYRTLPNPNGKDVTTLTMKQIKNFWLRVRLPCTEGTVCEKGKRYKIEANEKKLQSITKDSKSSPYDKLLHWDIQGRCKVKQGDGTTKENLCYMSDVNANLLDTDTHYSKGEKIDLEKVIGEKLSDIYTQFNKKNDSAITYKRLSDASSTSSVFDLPNTVLSFITKYTKNLYIRDGSLEIRYGPFASFFTSLDPWKDTVITNPLFRLSIASPLITTDNTAVNHIEYQLLYIRSDQDDTPIITNPVVIATGTSNDYSITLEKSVLKQGGAYGSPFIGK